MRLSEDEFREYLELRTFKAYHECYIKLDKEKEYDRRVYLMRSIQKFEFETFGECELKVDVFIKGEEMENIEQIENNYLISKESLDIIENRVLELEKEVLDLKSENMKLKIKLNNLVNVTYKRTK